MSALPAEKELQERLREASAVGDFDEVRILVGGGVNINSQNEVNGWTCLHWACKRNHEQIVSYLLDSGADKGIVTSKGELAVQLSSKPEIRRLFGVEEELPEVLEPELPVMPNYLSNPPFPYRKTDTKQLIMESHLSRNGSLDQRPHCEPPTALAPSLPSKHDQSSLAETEGRGGAAHTGPNSPLNPQGAVDGSCLEDHHILRDSGLVCSPVPSGSGPGSCANELDPNRQQSALQQLSTAQAFQPFFINTFPISTQELVVKVRIQDPNAKENDFIEVELDRQELTYRSLLRVCCRELGISADHVEKIRKLPNTMLRKDKDVARLQDFQELEVVLERAEALSLSDGGSGSLTDGPFYNLKASKLTY